MKNVKNVKKRALNKKNVKNVFYIYGAHSMCCSTVSANDLEKKQWPPNSPNLTLLRISCLGSDARCFLESFS